MSLSTILGLVLLLVVPGEALWRDWSNRPPRSQVRRYHATIAKALALLFALFIVARIEHITSAALGIGTQLGTAGYIGLAIALVVVSGLAMATLLAKPDPAKFGRHPTNVLMPEGPRELRLFLVLVPLIAFAWELLFRGYLLWWLAPLVGVPLAVLCAGISYGLAHGWKNARESFPSIAAAIVFATGYALNASFWWLIIIHIALPMIGFLAMHRAAATRNKTAVV